MKYFLDTEFFEDDKTIDLISIGIVAEDGRELYACNLDCRLDLAARDSWMRENVLAKLPLYSDKAWMPRRGSWSCPGIRENILYFMFNGPNGVVDREKWQTKDGEDIEIWGYYSATDWVAFYQIFGRMIDLPKQMPRRCRDLKQLADDVNLPKFPKGYGAHTALVDARWNRDFYNYLMKW